MKWQKATLQEMIIDEKEMLKHRGWRSFPYDVTSKVPSSRVWGYSKCPCTITYPKGNSGH